MRFAIHAARQLPGGRSLMWMMHLQVNLKHDDDDDDDDND